MMKKLITALFLFLLSSLTIAKVTTSYDHYDYKIYGNTASELRNEMNANGPGDRGTRMDAYTSWRIQWKYQFTELDGTCRMNDVAVTLRIAYTFPKWMNYEKGDAALKQKWNVYTNVLARHEEGHALHGQQAANEIDAAINQLPPMTSCDSLSGAANQAAQAIIAKYNEQDIQYDNETSHGMNEGAVFP